MMLASNDSLDKPTNWLSHLRTAHPRPIFALLILFPPLVALRIALLAGRRIPMGHDTFQYLQLQYTFFNEAAVHGAIPLWLPFMTQGAPSNFWIMISQGILASAVSPVAALFKHVNFLYLFETGMLFDEFLLLLGCVLLASRCYKSFAAVVFVSASLAYTSISSTQPWYDFHLYYLVPLVLYCLDRAIADASAWHLFIALLLGVAALLGNLPYFAPVIVFTVLVFGISVCGFAGQRAAAILRGIRGRLAWRHAVAFLLPVFFAGGIGLFLRDGLAHSDMANVGRGPHGEVSSAVEFLTYGGYVGLGKYAELISRYSNNLDNTLYSGLLVVPFALVTLVGVRSRLSSAFGFTALALASFGAATTVSLAFFFLFPFGKLFRHIGLTSPVAKMFLVFYAGFGFEAFWLLLRDLAKAPLRSRSLPDRAILLIPPFAVTLILVVVLAQRLGGYPLLHFPPWVTPTTNQLYLRPIEISLALGQLAALGGAFLMILLSVVRWPKIALGLGCFLLVLHSVDVLWLKADLEWLRVPRVSRAVFDLFEAYEYQFPRQRTQDYQSNSRFATLEPTVLQERDLGGGGREPHSTIGRYGALYWNMESFLFLDAPASPFRTDFWLDSIGAFYHVWISPTETLPRHLGFPLPASLTYRKLSGLDLPKLQVFSKIHVLPNDDAIGEVLRDRRFKGDAIFVAGSDALANRVVSQKVVDRDRRLALNAKDRLPQASLSVLRFTFDNLRLRVTVPSEQGAVLYYADAAHPMWRAYVDGERTSVWRTNLGYKAIIIPHGDSDVEFRFGSLFARGLFEVTVLLAILTVIGSFSLLLLDSAASLTSSPWSQSETNASALAERRCGNLSRQNDYAPRLRLEFKRLVLVYAGTFFFWNDLAVRSLREGVWSIIHVFDPIGLFFIPVGISLVGTLSCALAAHFTERLSYQGLVRVVAILGILVDLLVLVSPGLGPQTRSLILVHAAWFLTVGLIVGTRVEFTRLAYVASAALFAYAWFGSTLESCYIPGMAVNVDYDPNRSAYMVVVLGPYGRERYMIPADCYGTKDLVPNLALEGYRGYNVINLFGQYYAVRQSEGAFDIRKVESGAYDEVLNGVTIEEVRKRIDASLAETPTLVEEGYKGFNIVSYRNEIFAIPQSEGAFDGRRLRLRTYSRVFRGSTVVGVKQQIDSVR